MFYYIYKITNKLNGNFYIGKHTSKNLDNGYYGSGLSIKSAILKYGKENFTKEILELCYSAAECSDKEAEIVTEDLVKLNSCYNQKPGGRGGSLKGSFTHTQEFREKISNSNRTREYKQSTREIVQKIKRGRKWFNNGCIQTYQFEAPDQTWRPGMIKRRTPAPKFRENLERPPFWTDGNITKKSWSSPGEEWYRGMAKRKRP